MLNGRHCFSPIFVTFFFFLSKIFEGPRGRYGSTTTLKSAACTAACPAGRFGSEQALKNQDECQYCPPGTYGSTSGLTTDACTASCPSGKYSSSYGSSKASDCKSCPVGYRGWQCTGAILPRGSS